MSGIDMGSLLFTYFPFLVSVTAVGLISWDYFTPALSLPNLVMTEAQVTGLTADLASKVPLSGGTLTGPLLVAAAPTVALGVANKAYVDSGVGGALIAAHTVEAWSAILDTVSAGTYAGCTAITSVGTVTAGIWNAGIIPIAFGGNGSAAPAMVGGTNITMSGSWPAQTVSLSGVVSGTLGGTGVNNGASTITLGGNFITSGAFACTLTLTAATNVTLPVSGTLVNSTVATLSSLTTVGTLLSLTVSGAATFNGIAQMNSTLINATGGFICRRQASSYVAVANQSTGTWAPVITAAASGSTYIIAAQTTGAVAATLPAPAAGLNYRFICGATIGNAITFTPASGTISGLYQLSAGAAAVSAVLKTAAATFVITATAIKGDIVDIESDGVSWYIRGSGAAAASFS